MQQFREIFTIVIGTIGSICTGLILGYLNKKLENKKWSVLITVVLVSVVLIIVNYSLKNLIDNNAAFRRWIDPNNFIEGYWYEVSPPDSNNLIKHQTLVKITYNKGSYSFTGEDFDTSGVSYANFKSTNSAYNDGQLFFQYTGFNSRTHSIGQGFDQIQFNNPPNSYKGFVYSWTSKRLFTMEGVKLTEEELKRYNYFRTIMDKRKLIANLITNKRP